MKRSILLVLSSISLHRHSQLRYRIPRVSAEIPICSRTFRMVPAALSPQWRLGLLMQLARHKAR